MHLAAKLDIERQKFKTNKIILIVFSHIEQTTSDDPCEKYGLEYVFINLNLKLRTQLSGSK